MRKFRTRLAVHRGGVNVKEKTPVQVWIVAVVLLTAIALGGWAGWYAFVRGPSDWSRVELLQVLKDRMPGLVVHESIMPQPMRASVSANVLCGPATAISHAPTSPMPPART